MLRTTSSGSAFRSSFEDPTQWTGFSVGGEGGLAIDLEYTKLGIFRKSLQRTASWRPPAAPAVLRRAARLRFDNRGSLTPMGRNSFRWENLECSVA
jgi:hypothetical protein